MLLSQISSLKGGSNIRRWNSGLRRKRDSMSTSDSGGKVNPFQKHFFQQKLRGSTNAKNQLQQNETEHLGSDAELRLHRQLRRQQS